MLEPNYRGSAGYGEKFRSLNVRNLGIGDAWDVLSGIDSLVAQGPGRSRPRRHDGLEPGRLHLRVPRRRTTPTRFKAISVGAGISDWMTYYVNTDIHPVHAAVPEGDAVGRSGDLRRNLADDLHQAGEDADADPARRPADQRVPLPNAFELYQGLRDQNVPAQLIVFKGFGGIGTVRPSRRANRAAMQHNLDWFDQYICARPAAQVVRATEQAAHDAGRRFDVRSSFCCSRLARRVGRAASAARRRARPMRSSRSAAARSSPPRSGTIQNGTIVLRDGKIAAVGAERADSRRRRDRRRRPASSSRPGIIDAHSHIAADSINEGGTTVSSMTGIEDVLDPTDVNIYRDLAGGADDRQRAARQRQPDRRQEPRDQAALGQDARRGASSSKARCRASSSRSARTRSDMRQCRRADRAARAIRRRAWASST